MNDSPQRKRGFAYHLTDERLARYRAKPVERRLAWLYQGNVLRMHYPKKIIERHERFRR